MRFITLFAGFITLFSSTVSADYFPYKTKYFRTSIVCAEGVNCDNARRAFLEAASYIKEAVNMELVLVDTFAFADEMTGNPEERVAKWLLRTEALRRITSSQLIIVYTPSWPSLNNINLEDELTFGCASGIGVLGRQPALAYVKEIPNRKTTARITIHEIGHLIGGTHTDGIGIMAANANSLQYQDAYSVGSIREIEEYLSQLP